MSKQDYELISKAIREHAMFADAAGQDTLTRLVLRLSQDFKRENVRFSEDRFIDACSPGL